MNFLMTKIVRPIERVFPRYFGIALGIVSLVMIIDKFLMAWLNTPDSEKDCNTAMLVLLSFYCGVSRVWLSHPIFNRKYHQFLCLSPWQLGKPLPNGSIYLIWPDIIVIIFLTSLSILFPIVHFLLPAVFFIIGYLVCLTVAFLLSVQTQWLCLMLSLWALIVCPGRSDLYYFLVLLIMYGFGILGIRTYLNGFPWNTRYWTLDLIKEFKRKAIRRSIIQWPYSHLNIYHLKTISLPGKLFITMLFFLCIHSLVRSNSNFSGLIVFYFELTMMIVMIRVTVYFRLLPPISLWGRIWTCRWILPQYDKIFVAPIIIVLISCFGPWFLTFLGITPTLNYELILAINLFLSLILPPSLMKWQFTGPHRIVRFLAKPASTKKMPKAIELFVFALEDILEQ